MYQLRKPYFKISFSNKGITILLILCFELLLSTAQAQSSRQSEFKFQHVNKELNNSQIFSICEDLYGYLWIGTLSGLHRFDGTDFEIFFSSTDTTSVQENRIETIYEDRKGNLWIGTFDGICRYNRDQNNFIRYKTESELTNPLDPNTNRIHEIVEDDNGRLWVASQRNGLFYFDENQQSFVAFSKKGDDILETNHLTALCKDVNGIMWIGTLDDGAIKLDVPNHKATFFRSNPNDSESLAGNDVASIVVDDHHTVWIGLNSNGIDRVTETDNRTVFKHYRSSETNLQTLGNDDVKMLYIDSKNNLWSCNENGGLNLFDPEVDNFIRFTPDPLNRFSIHSTSYWSAYEDRQGRLWLGSSLDGLDVIDKHLVKFDQYYKAPGGLTNNIVRSFYEDRDENIWIATDGGGLNFYDRKKETFTAFRHDGSNPKSIRSNAVLAICEDNDGILWVGTWQGGINLFDRKKKYVHSFRT